MSDSSETNVIYKDKNGSNINIMNKDETTSTTMHFNLLANNDKSKNIPQEKPEEDSDSPIDSDIYEEKNNESSSSQSSKSSSSSSDSSKSKTQSVVTKIDFKKEKSIPQINQPNFSGFTQPPQNTSEINLSIKQLTPLELKKRKIEMLRKLAEIKDKGFELSKEYNISSDLEEMETEYELLKSFANKNAAINLGKGFLINGVGFLEFMNEKYDPFSFELKDWSKQVAYDCGEHEYDEVLGEIYEKYKGSGKAMEPEIKLAFLLGMSAASYHVTRSKLKPKNNNENVPLTSMAAKLGNQFLKKETSRFQTPDEIRIEQLKLQQKEKERQLKLQQQEMMMKQQQVMQPEKSNVEIKGPKNVNEILKKLSSQYKTTNPIQKEKETDSDRKMSESLTDTSKSSKKGRPKKKSTTLNLNL